MGICIGMDVVLVVVLGVVVDDERGEMLGVANGLEQITMLLLFGSTFSCVVNVVARGDDDDDNGCCNCCIGDCIGGDCCCCCCCGSKCDVGVEKGFGGVVVVVVLVLVLSLMLILVVSGVANGLDTSTIVLLLKLFSPFSCCCCCKGCRSDGDCCCEGKSIVGLLLLIWTTLAVVIGELS